MKKPNILIFMTDQQQAQVIAPGHPCRTPHVERMASEGITFTNAFTTMTHCCPARASFMTGLYPSQHGVYNNLCTNTAISKGLKAGVATFSERLKDAGYGLYFSGKWHVSAEENPSDRGWEELVVTAHKDTDMGETAETYRNYMLAERERPRERGELRRPGWGNLRLYGTSAKPAEEFKDTTVVDQAVAKLEELKESTDPWCLYVGTFGPHDPFVIPEPYASMYKAEDVPLPPNYHDTMADKPGIYRRMRKLWDQLSEEEVRESIAYYWGYCVWVDDMFGKVLDALERTGQKDDTMVLFLSDHGESAGAHGLYFKGISPYDETYRVPCVIRWPNAVANPGREVDKLISMMDFAVTFCDMAETEPLADSKGKSLLPWLRGEAPADWRDAVFNQCQGVEVYYTQRMVRTERYKFIYNPTDVDELYDLQEDPHELVNLAGEPAYAALKEELYMRIWREAADAGDNIFVAYPTAATAEFGPGLAIGKG